MNFAKRYVLKSKMAPLSKNISEVWTRFLSEIGMGVGEIEEEVRDGKE